MKKFLLLALICTLHSTLCSLPLSAQMRGFATVVADNDYQGGIVTLTEGSSAMSLTYGYDEGTEAFGWAIGCYDNSCYAVFDGNGRYLVYVGGSKMLPVDIATGRMVADDKQTISLEPQSMTYDYTDKRVYGCFKSGTGYVYGWFDPAKKPYSVTTIASSARYVAIAASPDGTVYAITNKGMTVVIDKATGDNMEVGVSGIAIDAAKPCCAAFNWNNGKMYVQHADDYVEGVVYTVNTTTGAATRQYSYGEWNVLSGFDFAYTPSEKVAPAAPTSLTASFGGAALTGKVTFKAPTTLVNGNPSSGALTYKLFVDGSQQASGSTSFGASVSADVTVTASGSHKFSAVVTNEAGDSPAAEYTAWIGYDQPETVANITAAYADGKIVLSWTAPKKGLNGGYFDPSALTYSICRGTETVATAVTACTYTDEVGVPTSPVEYTYTVYAVQGDMTSEGMQSPSVYAGAYAVPYLADFDDEAKGLDGFTIVNGGDERYTWRWANDAAQIPTWGNTESDDWLITPPIHLEAGESYTFRLDALCGGSGATASEVFRVYYGRENNVQSMTNELIYNTVVTHNDYKAYTRDFTVTATGDYFVGIQCVSSIRYYLQVDNVCVRLASDYGKPAPVSDLTLTPDYDGGLSARVQFTVPTTDVNGDPISEISQVKIFRDMALIQTFTDKTVGDKVDYVDTTVPKTGYHEYTVYTANSKGASPFVTEKCYVGANVPGNVTDVNVAEPAWGEASLTWTAPAQDVDGQPLNPALVTYDIYDHEGKPVASDVKGTSYTYTAVASGKEQRYIGYSVQAKTAGGESERVATGMLPFGEPTACPYAESFADKRMAHTFAAVCVTGNGGFDLCDDSQTERQVTSQDGDNGFLCIEGTPAIDLTNLDIVRLYSGKITVGGDQPALSFYYKGNGLGSSNSIRVHAVEWGTGAPMQELTTTPITTNVSNDWERVQLSLADFKGKTMRFVIEVYNVMDRYTYLDNIEIADMYSHDLEAYNFSVPAKARAGESMTACVTVQNRGAETASGWHVELMRGSDVVWTQEGMSLESGRLCLVYLYDTPPVFGAEEGDYSARVVYDADENTDNNTTASATVAYVMPSWQAVTDFKGEQAASDAVLTWARPTDGGSLAANDSFEDYFAWEKETIGDWHVYDCDGLNTLGLSTMTIPVAGQPAAFYVFASEEMAHTGSQCLAAFGSSKGDTEDWLVSPVLSGYAQTISFWERGFTASYPQVYYEVLVSSRSRNMSDFTVLAPSTQASLTAWKRHSYDLPEGTRYFAIRCTQAQFTAGLFVDDFEFEAGTHSTYDLKGYRLYRNRELLAELDAETLAYTDRDALATKAPQTYFVTAVYDKGESVPSESVSFNLDAIDAVSAARTATTTYDLTGRRVTTRQKGIVITDGKKIIR